MAPPAPPPASALVVGEASTNEEQASDKHTKSTAGRFSVVLVAALSASTAALASITLASIVDSFVVLQIVARGTLSSSIATGQVEGQTDVNPSNTREDHNATESRKGSLCHEEETCHLVLPLSSARNQIASIWHLPQRFKSHGTGSGFADGSDVERTEIFYELGIYTTIWKRQGLTSVVLAYYQRLQLYLLSNSDILLRLFATGSEGARSRALCERYGFVYYEHGMSSLIWISCSHCH